MNTPPFIPEFPAPEVEAERLAALRRYDILDTPPDGSFDRITSLAARLFSVPIALVSLVDEDRIWFKSKFGLDVEEIGRDPGLCASAIVHGKPWCITDASIDPRTMANPLVAGEFGLRFYVGVPLKTFDGHNLGTLCVIDTNPRELDRDAVRNLEDLASAVMDQMELRIAARKAVAEKELLLRELHHRVKNNLQTLMSVVLVADRHSENVEAKAVIRSLRGRLTAVTAAHQAMESAETLDAAQTGWLLRHLTETVIKSVSPDAKIKCTIEDHQVRSEQIMPLALLLNELLTNAAKHGVSDARGEFEVSFVRSNGSFELTVQDRGPGFPQMTKKSAGMTFIEGLARQLDGTFTVSNDGGARCVVRFPG